MQKQAGQIKGQSEEYNAANQICKRAENQRVNYKTDSNQSRGREGQNKDGYEHYDTYAWSFHLMISVCKLKLHTNIYRLVAQTRQSVVKI